MNLDGEVVFQNGKTTKKQLRKMDPIKRETQILVINKLELLNPVKKGLDLNEGYTYQVNSTIPELADGLAKMAVEMDKDKSLGEQGGGGFLTLIGQYYNKLKGGK